MGHARLVSDSAKQVLVVAPGLGGAELAGGIEGAGDFTGGGARFERTGMGGQPVGIGGAQQHLVIEAGYHRLGGGVWREAGFKGVQPGGEGHVFVHGGDLFALKLDQAGGVTPNGAGITPARRKPVSSSE